MLLLLLPAAITGFTFALPASDSRTWPQAWSPEKAEALAPPCPSLIYRLDEPNTASEAPGDRYGSSVAAAGDWNLDGWADVAVGEPRYSGGSALAGRVWVYSGRDGQVLAEFAGTDPSDGLGFSVAGAGDVDGDGVPDLIVGAPSGSPAAGAVCVYSGQDQSELYSWSAGTPGSRFGHAVTGGADVNADGVPDVIVGAPHDDGAGLLAGCVRVYSGADGELLVERSGAPGDQLGAAVGFAGDVDGDQHVDWIVGAPFADQGALNAGAAYLVSGATGTTLNTWLGLAPGDQLGFRVGAGEDFDGDGALDVLIVAPGADQACENGQPPASVQLDTGRADVRSALGRRTLLSVYGESPGEFLSAASTLDDVNGDGLRELIVGSPSGGPEHQGRVRVFSGPQGVALFAATGSAAFDWLGAAVAPAGDVNADGAPDWIVGAPGHDDYPYQPGSARVLSGRALALTSDNHSLSLSAGASQLLTLAGPAGSPYRVVGTLAGTAPGLRLGAVELPLAFEPLYFLHTLLNPNTAPLFGSIGVFPPAGTAQAVVAFGVGAQAALIGLRLDHAFLAFDSAGFPALASNPVPLTLGP